MLMSSDVGVVVSPAALGYHPPTHPPPWVCCCVSLQAQSLKEFVSRCEDADSIVVVSISPQSRASLAGEASLGLTIVDVEPETSHMKPWNMTSGKCVSDNWVIIG